MSKIIIHNESDKTDEDATSMVSRVIAYGFVSGEKQYCWHSVFTDRFSGKKYSVIAMKNRGDTHTFKVRNEQSCQ